MYMRQWGDVKLVPWPIKVKPAGVEISITNMKKAWGVLDD
jgi:hypothetical protein